LKAFESHWDDELSLFWNRNPDRSLKKSRFGNLFYEVWSRAVTPSNIMAGFRATAIYPADSVVPDKAFARALATEQRYDENEAPGQSHTAAKKKKTVKCV
jgi:hypothetical protein